MNKNVNTEYKYNYSPLAASFLMSATYRVLLVLSSEPYFKLRPSSPNGWQKT